MTSGPGHVESHVAIIGASLAGLRTAASLRELGFGGDLTLVDAETDEPYDRPPLSKGFLAQTLDIADVRLRETVALGASWLRGRRAVAASLVDRRVSFDDSTTLTFDALVIATGARARAGHNLLPDGDPARPGGVHVLRSLDDAIGLRRALSGPPAWVAVVGGGFIGTEVAATARGLGHDVALIDQAPVPLAGAVGHLVGDYVADLHRHHGVTLHLGAPVRELEAHSGRISGVVLVDGTVVPADLVVLGLGAVPNVDWLEHSGALLNGGVCTDAHLRVLDTSRRPVAGVVAAGDVARWSHPLFDNTPVRLEHWSNATDHAPIAARTVLAELSGQEPRAVCDSVPSFWSDQYDRKLMSVGLPHLGEEAVVLDGRTTDDRFVVGFGRRGRLVGAVAVGNPRALARYRRHIAQRGPWPPPANSPPMPTVHRSQRAGQA